MITKMNHSFFKHCLNVLKIFVLRPSREKVSLSTLLLVDSGSSFEITFFMKVKKKENKYMGKNSCLILKQKYKYN
jgi:hypothetical protein